MHVERTEIHETGIRAAEARGPLRWSVAGARHRPVVAPGDLGARLPYRFRRPHQVHAAASVHGEDVVVHLDTLDAVEQTKHRAPARLRHHGVVDEPITSPRLPGA